MLRKKRCVPPSLSTSNQHELYSSTSQPAYISPPLSEHVAHIGSSTQDGLQTIPTTRSVNQSQSENIGRCEPEVAPDSSSINQRPPRTCWIVDVVDDEGIITQTRLRIKDVFALRDGRRVVTEWNAECQPVGDSGGLLTGYLGSIASNFDHFPIMFETWRKVPNQYKLNIYDGSIKTKFVVDDGGHKRYIFASLGKKWKDNRCMLFNNFYNWELSFDQNCQLHPPKIPPDHWVVYLQYRLSEKSLEKAEKNAANRQKQVIHHTLGSKSLPRKKDEMEKQDKRPYSKGDMYPIAHKRKDGSYVSEEARRKAEQLQNEINASANENEAFVKVFGPEHPGRLRGVGFGVTKTQLDGPNYRCSDLSAANAKIQKLQSEVDGLKTQVVEMDALKAKLVDYDVMKAQVAFLMQNYKGNQEADLQSPREVRRSFASSHDPEDHGASSSHGLN